MGSIGDSAAKAENELVTWWQARRWLDARFVQLRQRALVRSVPDDPGVAIFLQVLNRKWKRAVFELKAVLCPQRQRKHKLRPVHTINSHVGRRAKTVPSRSVKQQALKRAKLRQRSRPTSTRSVSKRGRTRSHHPFNPRTGQGYVKLYPGPGRPKTPEAVKRTLAKLREQKKERRRKAIVAADRASRGLKIYQRGGPEKRRQASKRRGQSLRAARKEWTLRHFARLVQNDGSRFKDDRANHHPEKAYRKVKRKNIDPTGVAVVLALRAAFKGATRAAHLRGYWREVARIRANHQ